MRIDGILGRYLIQQGVADGRVYPLVSPQDEPLPFVTYTLLADVGEYGHDGSLSYGNARLELDVWSRSRREAADVGTQILRMLADYRGDMGGTWIYAILPLSTRVLYEADEGLYRDVTDYSITYRREV